MVEHDDAVVSHGGIEDVLVFQEGLGGTQFEGFRDKLDGESPAGASPDNRANLFGAIVGQNQNLFYAGASQFGEPILDEALTEEGHGGQRSSLGQQPS